MRPRSPKPTTSPPSALPPTPLSRDKYILLDCGASFGEGSGPIGRFQPKSLKPTELAGSASPSWAKDLSYLTLKLYELNFDPL